MAQFDKLIIFYKPAEGTYEYTKSFTLSFSRLNEVDNTYKKKAILEHRSKKRNRLEEYKMKEFHIGAKEILDKINSINFDAEYTFPSEMDDEYCIMYGDKKIRTAKKEEIQDILDMFNFDRVLSITHKHYEYIKDMDEYTMLVDILNSKIGTLNGDQLSTLSHIFKETNPYHLFQSMGWLPKYLDAIKTRVL